MINKSELPKNWEIIKFSDACRKISLNKIKIKQRDYLEVGKFPVVDQGQDLIGGYFNNESLIVPDEPPFIIFGDHTKIKKFINFRFIAGADGIKVLKPLSVYLPKFFFYLLHVIKIPDKGYSRHFQYLEKTEIPLPPLAEQERIIAKIEELFSELDAGIESLKTAAQRLKTYRQAVLKWAFEGKLTNENVNEGELPNGWNWIKSEDLFSFVTSGSRGWAKYYSDDGAIFVRITNLNFDTLDLDLREDKIKYVNPPKNSEGLRTKVQESDFLFSITGYLGMFAIAPKLENAFVNQHIALCRPKENFNKKYVGYWIISKSGGIHHLNLLRKGAVKAGLGLDDIKNFPVPICSLEEQQRIVEEIESRLSVCDKLEETISQSLTQSESLRQSILKQAFEGKLVSSEKEIETLSAKQIRFHQLQVLGLIVKISKLRNIRHGQMTSAKYLYLLDKIYGIKTYYDFKRGNLGPFPNDFKKTIFNKQYFQHDYNQIEIINEARLLNSPNPHRQEIENAVNELADIFSKTKDTNVRSHKTELLATVCKVIEDIQTTELKSVRQSLKEWKIDLKDKKFSTKEEKFDEQETTKCIEFIKQKGWDKKLIK